jgi:hypothetical protein
MKDIIASREKQSDNSTVVTYIHKNAVRKEKRPKSIPVIQDPSVFTPPTGRIVWDVSESCAKYEALDHEVVNPDDCFEDIEVTYERVLNVERLTWQNDESEIEPLIAAQIETLQQAQI